MKHKKVITIHNAQKNFGKRTVIDNLSMSFEKGKIFGLIGPSGAGKTTLIKCLLGIEKLDEGQVKVFNTTIPNRAIFQRIGYMGQSDALYNELTGQENLDFFGRLMGMHKQELLTKSHKYLELVHLTQSSHQQVKNYSGGMKRRLSLAITLLSNPDLLVLDEPTVGIDPALRVEIWDKLRQLTSRGKTIVMTTHVMDEAEKCDEVGLIIDGKLIALGTPKDLKNRYQVDTIEEVFLKAECE